MNHRLYLRICAVWTVPLILFTQTPLMAGSRVPKISLEHPNDFLGSLYSAGRSVDLPPVGGWSVERVAKNESSNAAFSKLKQRLCPPNQEPRHLSHWIRLILPKHRANTPLDVAAVERRDRLEEARRNVKKFYEEHSFVPHRMEGLRYEKQATSASFLALSFDPSEDFERAAREAGEGEGAFYYVAPPGSTAKDPTYLLFHSIREFVVPESWYRKTGAYSELNLPDSTKAGGYFMLPQQFRARLQNWQDGPRQLTSVFPLREAFLGDLRWLRDESVLVIPEAIQKKLFAGGADTSFKAWGLSDEGGLTPSQLLQDAGKIWSAYMTQFTRVQEAAAQDPRIFDFQLQLDLTIFCRFSQHRSELLTRQEEERAQ